MAETREVESLSSPSVAQIWAVAAKTSGGFSLVPGLYSPHLIGREAAEEMKTIYDRGWIQALRMVGDVENTIRLYEQTGERGFFVMLGKIEDALKIGDTDDIERITHARLTPARTAELLAEGHTADDIHAAVVKLRHNAQSNAMYTGQIVRNGTLRDTSVSRRPYNGLPVWAQLQMMARYSEFNGQPEGRVGMKEAYVPAEIEIAPTTSEPSAAALQIAQGLKLGYDTQTIALHEWNYRVGLVAARTEPERLIPARPPIKGRRAENPAEELFA